MKRRTVIFILALAGFLFASCKDAPGEYRTFEGFALGTTYSIKIKGTPEKMEGMQGRIDGVIAFANDTYSIYNEHSLLSRINRNETDLLDTHLLYLIRIAQTVGEMSGGMYDVTILPLKDAYGFSMGVPARENPNVDSLLQFVGYGKIRIEGSILVKERPEIRIDLNSVAKGYTVDCMARMLEDNGFTDYLVDIGGETFCRGMNPKGEKWRIGVETPVEGNFVKGNSIECVLEVSDVGMATSGNYRHFRTGADGRKYTHIINPLTGENTESRLLSATVIHRECAVADALATMFISLGPERALQVAEENPEMAVLFIYADDNGAMKTVWSNAMNKYIVK